MELDEMLKVAQDVDVQLDEYYDHKYNGNAYAIRLARVTKCCEESGEVWRALDRLHSVPDHQKEYTEMSDVLDELGDVVTSAVSAIQHLTKDTNLTRNVIERAFSKADERSRSDKKAMGS
jgi:NTP pyrophosphatase (non-canonical NTP hydrolase)